MKLLLLLFLLMLPFHALSSSSVSMAWEGSPDTGITSYVLYVGTNGPGKYTQVIPLGLPLLSYNTNAPPPPSTTNASLTVSATNSTYTNSAPIDYPSSNAFTSCTNSVCTNYGVVYTGLAPGLTYYFMVTARDAIGVESDGSNWISYNVPSSAAGIQTPFLRKY